MLNKPHGRSIAATATFCATASLTACLRHGTTLAPIPGDTSLGAHGSAFLAGGVVALLATLVASQTGAYARRAVALCSAVGFAFALRLSNLTDARRVLGFLMTPAHKTAFDPSLAYLAVGAVPLTSLLYRIGTYRMPKKGKVDGRLLVGAALFGVGWGIEGICRKYFFFLGRCAARSPLIDSHFDVCSCSRDHQFWSGLSDGGEHQAFRDLVSCSCRWGFSGTIIALFTLFLLSLLYSENTLQVRYNKQSIRNMKYA